MKRIQNLASFATTWILCLATLSATGCDNQRSNPSDEAKQDAFANDSSPLIRRPARTQQRQQETDYTAIPTPIVLTIGTKDVRVTISADTLRKFLSHDTASQITDAELGRILGQATLETLEREGVTVNEVNGQPIDFKFDGYADTNVVNAFNIARTVQLERAAARISANEGVRTAGQAQTEQSLALLKPLSDDQQRSLQRAIADETNESNQAVAGDIRDEQNASDIAAAGQLETERVTAVLQPGQPTTEGGAPTPSLLELQTATTTLTDLRTELKEQVNQYLSGGDWVTAMKLIDDGRDGKLAEVREMITRSQEVNTGLGEDDLEITRVLGWDIVTDENGEISRKRLTQAEFDEKLLENGGRAEVRKKVALQEKINEDGGRIGFFFRKFVLPTLAAGGAISLTLWLAKKGISGAQSATNAILTKIGKRPLEPKDINDPDGDALQALCDRMGQNESGENNANPSEPPQTKSIQILSAPLGGQLKNGAVNRRRAWDTYLTKAFRGYNVSTRQTFAIPPAGVSEAEARLGDKTVHTSVKILGEHTAVKPDGSYTTTIRTVLRAWE